MARKNSIEERKREGHHPSITVFIAGSMSAVICSVLLQPLDVMKTRLQNPNIPLKVTMKKYRMLGILKHIYQKESLKVLWYGTTATILRGIPAGGLYFCVYDWLKACYVQTPTTIQHVYLAMLSRATTDAAVIPLSVVKTRIESGVFKYDNAISGLIHIYRTEGFPGLTSGLLPILARDLPMSGTYIFFYSQAQRLLSNALYENNIQLVNSTCAGLSAILSCILTHPPDVIKTQKQLYPLKYPTIVSVITKTFRENGIQGYYMGLCPRLLKRTVFAVISWTLYENVKK